MNVLRIETLVAEGEDLIISRQAGAKKEDVPAYTCIGGNMDYKTREESYPELFDALANMSRIATWFFWTLAQHRNAKTNECHYYLKNINASKNVTRAYKELYELNLVKRIQKKHYMINPKVIFPQTGYYLSTLDIWNSLPGFIRLPPAI